MYAFIVSSSALTGRTGDDEWEHCSFVALEKAEEVFEPIAGYATSPLPEDFEVPDNRRSFVVLPGGAEDPAKRSEFAQWLAAQEPLQWVEVEFGFPDGSARVVRSG